MPWVKNFLISTQNELDGHVLLEKHLAFVKVSPMLHLGPPNWAQLHIWHSIFSGEMKTQETLQEMTHPSMSFIPLVLCGHSQWKWSTSWSLREEFPCRHSSGEPPRHSFLLGVCTGLWCKELFLQVNIYGLLYTMEWGWFITMKETLLLEITSQLLDLDTQNPPSTHFGHYLCVLGTEDT